MRDCQICSHLSNNTQVFPTELFALRLGLRACLRQQGRVLFAKTYAGLKVRVIPTLAKNGRVAQVRALIWR